MKFLADECFDERLAARMRSAGCDVERVPTRSGMDDLAVAALAEGDDRVLLTHDTDFGRVAVHRRRPRSGIVLVRAAVTDLDHVVERLLRLIRASGYELAGRITVLSDRGIRSRSIV